MTVPHCINESQSDMRGIKEGWYAMDDDGNLSSGPFSSLEECVKKSLSQRTETKASVQHGRTEALSPNIRPRAAAGDPTKSAP